MAATSSTLSESADNLKKTVEFFKIKKKLTGGETNNNNKLGYNNETIQIIGLKEIEEEEKNFDEIEEELSFDEFEEEEEDTTNKLTSYEDDEDEF
jgi:hypothetical protein